MRIERMIHELKELDSHVKTIQAYIYAKLGKFDNHTPADEEVYNRFKVEFELFDQRMSDLRIDLKIEQQRENIRKD
ncbi:hypothetical protein [Oceanobacillus massiliensis]|uniref:hypothetical protein n=1 Tax=Oceanobacillus massiliensis TaxID=1465765 RepID=UPI003018BBE3